MDPIAIQILEESWKKDGAILRKAVATMHRRLAEDSEGCWAATAFELNRFYNVLEKAFERLCETFENHFDKSGSYHERLIERMELPIGGIRPAFLPSGSGRQVRELKGFRHVMRHAYDLELDPERVRDRVEDARTVAMAFPVWCQDFLAAVRESDFQDGD